MLGRIWNLADRDQRGALGQTEFIIAMHLLTSYKSRAMTALPSVLPPGLYEAAARRGAAPTSRPQSAVVPPPGAIPRQFTGQRAQSPLARATPPPQYATPPPQVAQTTGSNWLITPQEKARFDQFFSSVDTAGSGFLTGDQAVKFFSDSGLPEETLATIWDLADINSEGQLNRDEFAVAMYLIKQQRSRPGVPLPAFLPPALVPPSMRNQPRATAQPTAPAFDNAANTSQLPKSAAEDLFGLDNPSPPPAAPAAPVAPVQTQQATGGSAAFKSPFDADPFAGSKPSSPSLPSSPQRQQFTTSTQAQPSIFKPFVPSSAFGATLASQNTGASATSSQARGPTMQQTPAAMDDLLGDNDTEESSKITEETTELANMSTQIGNLRNQMQDVQTKKTISEQNLSATQNQKRDLEQRLAQFRAQYEHEVRAVKTLEEQLAASRKETTRLQQEFAMIEGTYEDLQIQHKQVAQSLEADQRENASLKERISQLNNEISQLKPQIEKMRSDARQQKGMVAINKKQLATNESERDRLQSEVADLKTQEEQRAKDAEEERVRNAQRSPEPPSAVVSPAPSNTNPFFRNRGEAPGSGVASPTAFMASAPSPSAFDSLFGPAFSSSQQPSRTNTPPQTSFRSEHAPAFSAPSGPSVSSDGRPTPSATPPLSTTHDSPHIAEPPPPPESRQFTPGILPMRPPQSRTESVASSTRVAPPSRVGATDTEIPTHQATSGVEESPRDISSPPEVSHEEVAVATQAPPAEEQQPAPSDVNEATRTLSAEAMPGAFPDEATPAPTGSAQAPSQTNDDFDSAFASFGEPAHTQSKGKERATDPFESSASQPAPQSRGFNSEFPPIQSLEHDDDESETESERGFDDDFSSAKPASNGVPAPTLTEEQHTQPATEDVVRPSIITAESARSELPQISEQASPPTYEQTMSPTGHEHRDSNQFPPEFNGLLPSREDPTSPTLKNAHEMGLPSPDAGHQNHFHPTANTASTADTDTYQDAFSRPISSTTEAGPGAGPSTTTTTTTAHPAPASNSHTAFEDDFADFDNLEEAKEGGGEDFGFGSESREADEFNPTFDSPAASMTETMKSSQQTPTQATRNGFADFESSVRAQPDISTAFGSTTSPQATSHDWDAIFSGLDTPAPQVETGFGGAAMGGVGAGQRQPQGQQQETQKSSSQAMPQLGRAISTGSEHDDPILKRLTGMGYGRQQALDALEKFDYDINKVS